MRVLARGSATFAFAAAQSFVTCGLASAISTIRLGVPSHFIGLFLASWALAWITMLPIVLALAPILRAAIDTLVRDDDRNH